MIFAQVKLFHSSALTWNRSRAKNAAVAGGNAASRGSVWTPSMHRCVYSGHSVRRAFAAPRRHSEELGKSFVFVGGGEAVAQSALKWNQRLDSLENTTTMTMTMTKPKPKSCLDVLSNLHSKRVS